MQTELPSITHQRKFYYRTTLEEVIEVYQLLNELVFDNALIQPELEVKYRCRSYWGMCYGDYIDSDPTKPTCKIRLMKRWYTKQWMIVVLAHEMCHQYQWLNLAAARLAKKQNLIMSHGPSFFVFKQRLAEFHIPLRKTYSPAKWFKHQCFFKFNTRLNTICEI